MTDILTAYIPIDRRQALLSGRELPEQTTGVALFADISGFTPLTATLARELGPQRGAEEVLRHINPVYEALIGELHRYRGAVIGFAGDSITCWFDESQAINSPQKRQERGRKESEDSAALSASLRLDKSGQDAAAADEIKPVDAAARALTCALAMQRAMNELATVTTAAGATLTIAVKIALAAGPARRFAVGDPAIQRVDTLVGATLDRVAAVENITHKGEIAASVELVDLVGEMALTLAEWRANGNDARFAAVVTDYLTPVDPDPWPLLDNAQIGDAEAKVWLLPPVYDRLQSGGRFLAELRPTVPLFLKFDGLDYDGDAAVGRKLDAYVRWVQAVLARYEGFMLQLTIGDKGSYLYAGFGAPLAHDDDALRAVAAALDLRTPPSALDFIRSTHIGLSQGRMWCGACGAVTRRTYGVMGAETNMAARLMSQAGSEQILVSERLAAVVDRTYALNPLGRIPIKGKSEPLAVSEVIGRRITPTTRSLFTRYTAPLFERDAPLSALHMHWQQAQAGQGQIVRLEGSTGVGKSHLMAVFGEMVQGMGGRLAAGYGLSINQSIAYTPWRQIIYELLDLTSAVAANPPPEALAAQVETTVQAINPDWLVRLPLLGDLLGLPIPDNPATVALDARLRQESLFALVTAMLHHWAGQQPLLLVLEDIHWLDDVSLALAAAVGRSLAAQPLLLALVQRPTAADDPLLPQLEALDHHHRVTLDDLSPAGVAAMVDHALSGSVAPLVPALIAAKTEGNPFFVEEMVGSLRESGGVQLQDGGRWELAATLQSTLQQAGCLWQQDGEWQLRPNAPLTVVDLGVPDSIQGIVLSRIDRLQETHKLFLKVASVIGQRFELNLVRLSHPPVIPDPETAVQRAHAIEVRDFIRRQTDGAASGSYTFRHNTTQEVAYATLLFEQRRQLHQTVCEVLAQEQPDNVSALAYHAFLGEDWPRALHYDLLAARQARKIFANKEAVTHLQRAQQALAHLSAAAHRQDRLEITILLGEILVQLGQYEAATAELEAGLELAETMEDDASYVEICRWLTRRWELAGKFDAAWEWIERGLTRMPDQQPAAATELLTMAGLINSRRGNQDVAQALAEEGLKMAESVQDNNLRGQARNLLGLLARLRGAVEPALVHYQAGLALYEAVGNLYGVALTNNHMANAYFNLGRWSEAYDHYQTARQIFEQIGAQYDQAIAENNLGQLALYRGDPTQALTLYQSALDIFQQTGKSLYVLGVVEMNLGATYVQLGETDKAAPHLQTAADYFERAGVGDFLSELHRYLALMHLRDGRLTVALAEAETAVALARDAGMTADEGVARRVLGQIQQAQGEWEQAAATLQNSLEILTTTDDRYETEQTEAALAELRQLQQGLN